MPQSSESKILGVVVHLFFLFTKFWKLLLTTTMFSVLVLEKQHIAFYMFYNLTSRGDGMKMFVLKVVLRRLHCLGSMRWFLLRVCSVNSHSGKCQEKPRKNSGNKRNSFTCPKYKKTGLSMIT